MKCICDLCVLSETPEKLSRLGGEKVIEITRSNLTAQVVRLITKTLNLKSTKEYGIFAFS